MWCINTIIVLLLIINQSKKRQFSFPDIFLYPYVDIALSLGPTSPYAPWKWRPGNTGWQAVCHWRPLERYGGGLWRGGGGLQQSLQHLGGGVLSAKTLVLQWSVHNLPCSIPVAWAFSHRDNITALDSCSSQIYLTMQNGMFIPGGHCVLE